MGLFSIFGKADTTIYIESFKEVPEIMEELDSGRANEAWLKLNELDSSSEFAKPLEVNGNKYARKKDMDWYDFHVKNEKDFIDYLIKGSGVPENQEEALANAFKKVYFDTLLYQSKFDNLCDPKNGFWNGHTLNFEKALPTINEDIGYMKEINREVAEEMEEEEKIRKAEGLKRCFACRNKHSCKDLWKKDTAKALECDYFC